MARRSRQTERPLDEEAARETCLRLLAVRARTESELRERLARRGFPPEPVDSAMSALVRTGLVDDEDFARSWVAARIAAGGIGRRRLAAELRQKGVARDIIERTLAEAGDEAKEEREAEALARKRLGAGPVEARDLARVRRYLLGRGFGVGTVGDVVRRIGAELQE